MGFCAKIGKQGFGGVLLGSVGSQSESDSLSPVEPSLVQTPQQITMDARLGLHSTVRERSLTWI